MRPKIIRISPYAATDPNGVSVSQTPNAGGIQELSITGVLASVGVATMDIPRQVLLTFAGDESARTFVVTGTNLRGNSIIEAVAGGGIGTVQTVQAFNTVTSIKIDDDSAGAIQAGTATVVSSNWVPISYLSPEFEVAMAFDAGLAATTPDFTVEYTLSNIMNFQGDDVAKPRIMTEFDMTYPTHSFFSHSTLVNLAADATGNLDFPVRAIRLKSNGVFTTGGVTLHIIQGGGR